MSPMEREAAGGSVRVLLNFPQNPSGYSPTAAEAKEIVGFVKSLADRGTKVMVWCDDAYFGLDYEEDIEKQSLFAYLADLSENVLVAGRCISVTHEAQASVRIMPICCATGEAAGAFLGA